MDVRDAYRRAMDGFEIRVGRIRDGDWSRPTPDTEWDVRALVNHMTAETLWVPEMFAGRTISEVGDRYDGDVLGDDPVRRFREAAPRAVEAVRAEGALGRTVHLSAGDTPGTEYAWQLFADALIHTWDLARGIGADDRLDPELVEACAEWFEGEEDSYRRAGIIAARVPVPDAADPQTRLLAAFGRRA
ncbi:TIGR03086 family metal-binding protein [Bailinhaonella thermotolerans]|uniref:TIGR03086 family protein n=1 Tax=Bailinhaonella thermotolerans TaxID=1070861 RepID=A0A3A4BA27_9ACTN|nr:TIGR03086 family metal-binding protein [Bailinhaonella thermotolerans]RJL34584.1 TIGR03086 family protein [Bailinhaonella thermotolerans]